MQQRNSYGKFAQMHKLHNSGKGLMPAISSRDAGKMHTLDPNNARHMQHTFGMNQVLDGKSYNIQPLQQSALNNSASVPPTQGKSPTLIHSVVLGDFQLQDWRKMPSTTRNINKHSFSIPGSLTTRKPRAGR